MALDEKLIEEMERFDVPMGNYLQKMHSFVELADLYPENREYLKGAIEETRKMMEQYPSPNNFSDEFPEGLIRIMDEIKNTYFPQLKNNLEETLKKNKTSAYDLLKIKGVLRIMSILSRKVAENPVYCKFYSEQGTEREEEKKHRFGREQ